MLPAKFLVLLTGRFKFILNSVVDISKRKSCILAQPSYEVVSKVSTQRMEPRVAKQEQSKTCPTCKKNRLLLLPMPPKPSLCYRMDASNQRRVPADTYTQIIKQRNETNFQQNSSTAAGSMENWKIPHLKKRTTYIFQYKSYDFQVFFANM